MAFYDKYLEGKSEAERKKLMVAALLGLLSLTAVLYAMYAVFGGGTRYASSSNSNARQTPTPKASASPNNQIISPADAANEDVMANLTPLTNPFPAFAPGAGRNIFAFFNPADQPVIAVLPRPKPSAAAVPTPENVPTPTPEPPPPLLVAYVTPAQVYSRTGDFTLEVNGDKFTPESKIYFNGTELPTRFVSPQQLTATVPAALIAAEGQKQIYVRTPDGKLYSNPFILTAQAPPAPQYLYVGLIGRKRYNNDIAVLIKKNGKDAKDYVNVKLNDSVERFRVVSISSAEVVMEDTQLKLRHRLPYQFEKAGQSASSNSGQRTNTPSDGFPANPYGNPTTVQPAQSIPGIPDDIPRYNPNQPNQPNQPNPNTSSKPSKQDDVDDNEPIYDDEPPNF